MSELMLLACMFLVSNPLAGDSTTEREGESVTAWE